ncbi:hypothetical protein, unlikely [Trypanosoma brucei gambiense DAL972]|uniref:Uncharacterized protein n=1 Tax=Trypanosoma brucei gambiense (strain MHOM/CI/86/DAL972) TaxID=679716 RepID=C9ZSS8_TRYB9|nr:hypothetical protein, unlikely [Trypanosoma brucei gambiense DAL972]CBH12462.1 hypothetical protein, unlikely [Trypanosoma brucei gambiense DAL972]|eukprot:XP_011774743.1 hypothetical protein, unlikely [Trypanosoma brucei gambiense DAL972]
MEGGGEKKSCGRFTLHFRILKSHELVLVHHYTSMSTEGKEKRKENNNNTNRHTHIHVQTKQNKNTIRKTLKTNNTTCLRVRACRRENTRRNERWWGWIRHTPKENIMRQTNEEIQRKKERKKKKIY